MAKTHSRVLTEKFPRGVGGNGKNKTEKEHHYASLYFISTMYEKPVGPRPPSAHKLIVLL